MIFAYCGLALLFYVSPIPFYYAFHLQSSQFLSYQGLLASYRCTFPPTTRLKRIKGFLTLHGLVFQERTPLLSSFSKVLRFGSSITDNFIIYQNTPKHSDSYETHSTIIYNNCRLKKKKKIDRSKHTASKEGRSGKKSFSLMIWLRHIDKGFGLLVLWGLDLALLWCSSEWNAGKTYVSPLKMRHKIQANIYLRGKRFCVCSDFLSA